MIQPVPSSLGDVFNWQTQVTIASNVAGANEAAARLQVDSGSFFVLLAFLGSTNYDQCAGDFISSVGAGPAAARVLITPPFVPNNFEVMIRYNDDINLMGGRMPQACLCANGYFTGQMLPIPTIFPPMTMFNFDFYNVVPTILQDTGGSNRSLIINFGLYGLFVPEEQLSNFLATWPGYAREAQQGVAGWIEKFTKQALPAGV